MTEHQEGRAPQVGLQAPLAILTGEGIRSFPLKGATLAIRLGRAIRPSRDIDILVHRSDRRRAVNVLERSGYRALPRSNGLIREIHLISPRAPCVDLHWHLAGAEIGMPLDFDRLWAEREEVLVEAMPVPFPSLPWLLLITSFLVVRDLPLIERRHLHDLARIVELLDGPGWQRAAEIASHARTRRLVAAAIRACGADLPAPADAAFSADESVARALALLQDRLASPLVEEKARFATRLSGFLHHRRFREDWRDRLRPIAMLPLFLLLPDDVDAARAEASGRSPWRERLGRVPEVAGALLTARADHRRSTSFEVGLSEEIAMVKPAADVSLHLVGDAGLLLRAGDQTLFGLSTTAAWLWCRLEENGHQAGLAGEYAETFAVDRTDATRIVRESLRHWWQHGLLEGGPRPAPEPRSESERQTPWHLKVLPAHAELRCRLLDQVVEIGLPDAAAAAGAQALLGHLVGPGRPTIRLDVVADDDGFAIVRDGAVVERADSRAGLAPQIKSAAIVAALNVQGFRLFLHAAMLRHGASALLLPAAPGSGKTCLSAALARAGLAYHSDEVTLLEGRGLRARGVPVALTIKEPAWPILGPLYPEIDTLTVHHRIDGKVCRYLPPPVQMDDPALHTWWPVRALIFPRFDAGAITRLEPLDKLDALQRLLSECLAIPAGLDGGLIEDLAQWMEGVEAFSLPFSDLDSALTAIRSCSALAGMDGVVGAAASEPVAAEGDRTLRAARSPA